MRQVVASVVLIVGLLAPIVAVGFARRSKREGHWLQVSGTIIQSEVEFDGEFYVPAIQYHYSHDSISRCGRKVRTGLVLYNWSNPAKEICARYPRGAAVTVFVDPKDPENSVLEPGGGWRLLPLVLAVSIIFVLCALATLIAVPGAH